MEFDEELITHTVSLTQVHLSQAIDLYLVAKEKETIRERPYDWIQSRYNAISSIIHSYSALESVISETGHQVFFEKSSYLYIAEESRDYSLKRVISSWKSTSCIDKLHIIIEQISQGNVPSRLAAELRELNILRNWIVHGFVFKTTLLLEAKPEEKGTFNLIDREDSIDWSTKFPNTKFTALDELNDSDARKALVIALSIILFVFSFRREPFTIISYHYGPYYHLTEDNYEETEKVLDSYVAKASNHSLEKGRA